MRGPLIILLALACCGLLRAEDPVLVFPPLPRPLVLPPGLSETLPLNKTGSMFGDAIRAVDCPDTDDPYGNCGNELFGGIVMGDSQLSGVLHVNFSPPVNNVAHFQVTHDTLTGDDSQLVSPMGYELPMLKGAVSAADHLVSQGDLDLTTGGVINLNFYFTFANSAIASLANVNPKLQAPVIAFPGVRGHAWAKFEQRSDGLLDFTFRGSTFLPLGQQIDADNPIRFPLPFCGPGWHCASILARGTSFHPHIYLSTRAPEGPACGAVCPDIPFNTIQEFTLDTYHSSYGDDFALDIPQLGGTGPARSHLQGRLQIQFGSRNGNTVPFVIRSLVPQGLIAKTPVSPILGPGFSPGFVGQNEILPFPLQSYPIQRAVMIEEPYNFTQGAIDLNTGRVIGEMVFPSYYGQTIAEVLFPLNILRISKDPFFLIATKPEAGQPETTYAFFQKGPNGETVFRFSGEHVRSFAEYLFPTPALDPSVGFTAGPAATLDLFLRLRGIHSDSDPNTIVRGGATGVTSSLGDRFSYSYAIACDGSTPPTFEYSNSNAGKSGGTFQMVRLAAVECSSSPGSAGDSASPDVMTFSGFGVWSKDAPDSLPRFASVQVSTAPDAPYVGILVFQNPDPQNTVIVSSANTKPPQRPLP